MKLEWIFKLEKITSTKKFNRVNDIRNDLRYKSLQGIELSPEERKLLEATTNLVNAWINNPRTHLTKEMKELKADRGLIRKLLNDYPSGTIRLTRE